MIEFGLDPKEDTHIVNGHVPVKRKDVYKRQWLYYNMKKIFCIQ